MQGCPPLCSSHLSFSGDRLVVAACLAGFLSIIGIPLAGLLSGLVHDSLIAGGIPQGSVILSQKSLYLLIKSVFFSGSVAIAGTILGMLAALFLWQYRNGRFYNLRWLAFALIAIPSYIHALAWSSLVSYGNGFLHIIGIPALPSSGWAIAGIVQVMALLPIAVLFSCAGLESVDTALIEAARMQRDDTPVFFRIILPLAAPAVGAGCGFLFLLSCIDYSVPSLFSADVYALEIFAQFSATGNPAVACVYALPLLVVTGCVLLLCQSGMRSFAQQPVRPGRTVTVPLLFPAWFLWLQRGAACLLVLQVAIVTGDLLVLTGSPGRFVSSVSLAVGDLVFSLGICALATVIALAVAPAVARELFKTDRRGRFFWLAVTLPLALPAPLVGIGLILFWNRMLDSPLYGSALMPVHAVLARFAPVAVIILFARMRMIDPVLHDAARVFQSSAFSRWSAIDLPLLAPGFVVAACMFFALAVGELGATLIVAPAGHATVTMRIYNYLHFGSSADVAGLCLMMTILTLASGFIAILVFSKKESGGGILHTGASSMEVLHD